MGKPIPDRVLVHCSVSLKVLAHPLRLRIVDLLHERRHTVGELAEALAEPPAAVSQHLGKMKAAGLLDVERHGRLAYYRVTNPACLALLGCIRRNFA